MLVQRIIHQPILGIMALILGFACGLQVLKTVKIDLFPDVTIPVISVVIAYPGASPEEIESQIINLVEPKLGEVLGIKHLHSKALQGLATFSLEFPIGEEIDLKRAEVMELLQSVSRWLPEDANDPDITTFSAKNVPVMYVAIYGEEYSHAELLEFVTVFKNEFLGNEYVAQVLVGGGVVKEMEIRVDPLALHGYRVSLNELIQFFKNASMNIPGGNLKIGAHEYSIRVLGSYRNADDLNKLIVKYDENNRPIYLKDLATTLFAVDPNAKAFSKFNGHPTVYLSFVKKEEVQMDDFNEHIERRLEYFNARGRLPDGIHLVTYKNTADDVAMQLGNLKNSIEIGMLVVFFILFASVGLRVAFMAALGIPFAMICGVIGLFLFDESLNVVSQMGFIIVNGMIVDGAIVVLENIDRHMCLPSNKERSSRMLVAFEEVGGSLISSSLTTIFAFSPLLFLEGFIGQFMKVIPMSVSFSLIGGMIFDHVVLPALSMKYYTHSSWKLTDFLNKITLIRYFFSLRLDVLCKEWFVGIFRLARRHSWLFMLIITGSFLLSGKALSYLPKGLFPPVDSGKFEISVFVSDNSSLKNTELALKDIESKMIVHLNSPENPEGVIKYFMSTCNPQAVGRFPGEVIPPCKIYVELLDEEDRTIRTDVFMAQVRLSMTNLVKNMQINFEQLSGPRVGKPVSLVLQGNDLNVLKKISNRLQTALHDIPGLSSPQMEQSSIEISVDLDREKIAQYGLKLQDIQLFIQTMQLGYEIGDYHYDFYHTYKIKLRLSKDGGEGLEYFENLSIYVPSKNIFVPLRSVARPKFREALSTIVHKNFKRSMKMEYNVDQSLNNTYAIIETIQNLLKSMKLPPGYSVLFSGEYEKRQEIFSNIGYVIAISLLLIYITLIIQFGELLQPIIILLIIPLCLLGVSVALSLIGGSLDMMALFGTISVAGIVVNDAIVLISYVNTLRLRDGLAVDDAIIRAIEDKFRPIMMTTLTTIGGILPLALAWDSTSMFWKGYPASLIGGLIAATLQTLIVVPWLYIQVETMKRYCNDENRNKFMDLFPKLLRDLRNRWMHMGRK